jgi:putative ABC transport system permease protein
MKTPSRQSIPRFYRFLLHLMPPGFRERFGGELGEVLRARLHEARGPAARGWIWTVAVVDLLTSAPPEWSRALLTTGETGDRRRGMDELVQDIKYALGALYKAPAFAAVAVLTVGLGIGSSTAVFSVVNAVLLRPLPYAEPERVARIQASVGGTFGNWLSQPEIVDIEESVPALEAVGSWLTTSANLTGDGEPERLRTAIIMPEAFQLLGVRPALGRTFSDEEGVAGGDGVAIISHALFRSRYGSDASLIGRSIEVDRNMLTVVGVLPDDFRLLSDFQGTSTDLFVPLVLNRDSLQARGSHSYETVARLAPGATLGRAQQELDALVQRLTAEGLYNPERPFAFKAVLASENVIGDVRRALYVLLGAVGFVLLIACANVANLLLARGEERQREMSVRAAMGAGRFRILRQLLTESVVLALLGGSLGAALALVGTRLLAGLDVASVPRSGSVGVDGSVLGFALLVTLSTGLIFGTAPALQASRHEARSGLREGSRGGSSTRGWTRFRRALVVGELAFAVVLLVGAGLMTRTFQALRQHDVGFEPSGLLSFTLSLPTATYPGSDPVLGFYQQLLAEVEALPGVQSASAVRILPLSRTIGNWSIQIEGRMPDPRENPNGDWQSVTPGYFETMGMRLVEGRFLEAGDDGAGTPVAVINRTMADTYWPEGALGKRFRTSNTRPYVTIVGVVEDVSRNALVEAEARPEMYHPHAQPLTSYGAAQRSMTVVIKSDGDPRLLFPPIRQIVRRMDPNLPISEVRTVEEVLGTAMARERFTATLLGTFGALAMLLAVVGVYGVQAYSVSRRTHEIGIRMALGAGQQRVLSLVLSESARLVVLGLAIGTVLAFGLTRLMGALLYGVEATDPLTFVGVVGFLGACALLATAIPAARASGVPPTEALRAE